MKSHYNPTVTLTLSLNNHSSIWDKVFKNGLSKICGRQPLKNLNRSGLLKHLFYRKPLHDCF